MKKLSLIIALGILFTANSVHALELAGGTALEKGQNKITVGADLLHGIISPPNVFTHSSGNNNAFVLEERIKYARGFGNIGFLKDFYLEVDLSAFQSRQETVNGAQIYAGDNGYVFTLRSGANLIHTDKWTLGFWLQGSAPIAVNKEKFVKPNIHYGGGGVNAVVKLHDHIGMAQSVFIGSGLSSSQKNPQIISSTLGLFNIGQWLFKHDVVFKFGAVVESDLTSRTDNRYQASALGNGRIQNLVFITPFLFDISLGKEWTLEVGHATKWVGRSVRGSQFTHLAISKKF